MLRTKSSSFSIGSALIFWREIFRNSLDSFSLVSESFFDILSSVLPILRSQRRLSWMEDFYNPVITISLVLNIKNTLLTSSTLRRPLPNHQQTLQKGKELSTLCEGFHVALSPLQVVHRKKFGYRHLEQNRFYLKVGGVVISGGRNRKSYYKTKKIEEEFHNNNN